VFEVTGPETVPKLGSCQDYLLGEVCPSQQGYFNCLDLLHPRVKESVGTFVARILETTPEKAHNVFT
jgi:hypothetical protein